MSLDLIRDDLLNSKKTEIAAAWEAHQRHLRALYRLTKFVATPPVKTHDFNFAAPPTPDEDRFLDESDLHRGRLFHEESLPFPSPVDAPAALSKVKSAPSPLPVPNHHHASLPLSPAQDAAGKPDAVDAPVTPAVQLRPAIHPLATPPLNAHTPPRSPYPVHKVDSQSTPATVSHSTEEQSRNATEDGGQGVTPGPALQTATDGDSRVQEQGQDGRVRDEKKHAKVVHLPPKEEQIRHIHEIESAQEAARRREKKEDASAALSIVTTTADAASSPSSPAGPASTSSPKPTQPSPDTSPDVEVSLSTRADVLRAPPDPNLSSAAAKATVPLGSKEDEEDTATPDAQLRQEDAQASRAGLAEFGEGTTTAAALPPLGTTNGERTEQSRNKRLRAAGQPDSPAEPPNKRSKLAQETNILQDVVMKDAPITPAATPSARRSSPPPRQQPSVPDSPAQPTATSAASGGSRQRASLGNTRNRPRSAHGDHEPASQVLVTSRGSRLNLPLTPFEERSKHSLVVFSKKDKDLPRRDPDNDLDGYLALKGASLDQNKDYMRPLFVHQAYQAPRAAPTPELVASARKIVTTSNFEASIKEQADYRILRRIYQLQNLNKWSLRQMAKCPDPPVPVTHQDHLMKEMKWLRTDFREERRWKMAVARNLAEWCALYVKASDEVKPHLRVKVKQRRIESAGQPEVADSFDSTPPLEHSGFSSSEQSSPEELPPVPMVPSTPPTALFWLGYDDLLFQIDNTPAAEGVLSELPSYEAKSSVDAVGPKSLLPVSKYTTGKLIPFPSSAPRKKSRYDFEEEESEVSGEIPAKRRNSEISLFMSPSRRTPRFKELSPEESDVALFNPVNKHIKERLHATHAFRPPSEFVMPSTNFFECRQPSQWTWEEDQKLRKCVKDYSYNWSIIAIELTSFTQPSKYVSGTERRTPWECFERWVQLEGLPNDMGKTQYFRTWLTRLEAANKAVQQQRTMQQSSQQQAQTPNQIPQPRVKGTQPYRVERRRDARYISMVDAIRKVTRKRETLAHRQHEAAKAAALRKQQQSVDNNAQRMNNARTPADWSRIKYERDQKTHERQEVYRRQMLEQQQKNAQLQQRSAQMGMPQGMANLAAQQARNGAPNNTQGPAPNMGQLGPSPSHLNMQARHAAQSMMPNGAPNGNANGIAVGMQMPHAQMQGLSGQRIPNLSQEQIRIAMQQQRQLVQAQNQQQFGMLHAGQANGLAAAHLTPANGAIPNQQMLAALAAQQRAAGMASSMASGMAHGSSTSPRGPHPNLNLHKAQLSSGLTPTITYFQQKAQQQYPHFSQEDIMKIAHEQLKSHLQRATASAASAAAGMPAMMNNAVAQMGSSAFAQQAALMGAQHSQQYQAQLHRQMQQQQQARMSGSPGLTAAQPRPASRSATPQGPQMQNGAMMHQRSGSGHGTGMGQEMAESPRLPTAQMARP